MAKMTQDGRVLSITTPLGKDKLLLESFQVNEAMSEPFQIHASMFAEDPVDPMALLGKDITIEVKLTEDGPSRKYHGRVKSFAVGGKTERIHQYQLTAVPWFWFLTRCHDHLVFQDMTAKEIVEKIFQDNGFSDFEFKLNESYTKRDYCLQHGESTFTFVSRVLEEEGIYYYFDLGASPHKMILCDDKSVHQDNAVASLPFVPDKGMPDGNEGVFDVSGSKQVTTGKLVIRDAHFQMPTKTLESTESTSADTGDSKLEWYEFPGDYVSLFNKPDERLGDVEKQGKHLSKMAIEREEAQQAMQSMSTNCASLAVGTTFDVDADESLGGPFLITSVQHTGIQTPRYFSEESVANPFKNTCSCIPKDVQYRPPRVTPRAIIHGMQTATVVGPSGEEIYTDKYGRVKVQFPWDREGQNDESSGCWLRVAQLSAGQQWGAFMWPRIGHEVLVAFLHGDPDQPIICGSLYNAENMPPYAMPDNQTRSGFKSRSSKSGSDENFNELRFEDKKDEEEIYFHAEKDFNRVVENNDTLKVGFEKKDSGDQTIEIFNNQDVTIGDAQASDGSQTIEIKKDRTVTLKEGNDKLTIEMGNRDVKLKMGNETVKLDLGKSTKQAMQSIELKVGSSSIKVDQMGVTIKGMMVKIEGTTMTDIKGMMTKVQGSAMLKASGALTMIN